jgi:hypothetical protein
MAAAGQALVSPRRHPQRSVELVSSGPPERFKDRMFLSGQPGDAIEAAAKVLRDRDPRIGKRPPKPAGAPTQTNTRSLFNTALRERLSHNMTSTLLTPPATRPSQTPRRRPSKTPRDQFLPVRLRTWVASALGTVQFLREYLSGGLRAAAVAPNGGDVHPTGTAAENGA